MLDVTYTMSGKVEWLKYTEIYKTGMDARRDETIVDGLRSLPDPAHFKSPAPTLFFNEILPSKYLR